MTTYLKEDFAKVFSHEPAYEKFFLTAPDELSGYELTCKEELKYDFTLGDLIIDAQGEWWEVDEKLDFLRYTILEINKVHNKKFYKSIHKTGLKLPIIVIDNGASYLS